MILYVVSVFGECDSGNDYDERYVATSLPKAKRLFKEKVEELEGNGDQPTVTLTRERLANLSKKKLAVCLLARRGYLDSRETLAEWEDPFEQRLCEECREWNVPARWVWRGLQRVPQYSDDPCPHCAENGRDD